jgi:hypothetical protein
MESAPTSLQLDSGGGTGGTGGTAERAGVGGGGTGQGTAEYQLALAEQPVPPGTLLGTTLPEHFPFEYRLYPVGEGGSSQATMRPPTRRRSNVDVGRRSAKPNLSCLSRSLRAELGFAQRDLIGLAVDPLGSSVYQRRDPRSVEAA